MRPFNAQSVWKKVRKVVTVTGAVLIVYIAAVVLYKWGSSTQLYPYLPPDFAQSKTLAWALILPAYGIALLWLLIAILIELNKWVIKLRQRF